MQYYYHNFFKVFLNSFPCPSRIINIHITLPGIRDVAQPGSAHVWGAWGRKFESCHPDLTGQTGIISVCPVFIFAVILVRTVYHASNLIESGSSK